MWEIAFYLVGAAAALAVALEIRRQLSGAGRCASCPCKGSCSRQSGKGSCCARGNAP